MLGDVLIVQALTVLMFILQTCMVVFAVDAHDARFEIIDGGVFGETLSTVTKLAGTVNGVLAGGVVGLMNVTRLAVHQSTSAVGSQVDTHDGRMSIVSQK